MSLSKLFSRCQGKTRIRFAKSLSTSQAVQLPQRSSLIVSAGVTDEWTNIPAVKLLESLPRGPYTAIRTVEQKRLFQYSLHIDRLQTSSSAFGHVNLSSDIIADTLSHVIKNGLSKFWRAHPKIKGHWLPPHHNSNAVNKSDSLLDETINEARIIIHIDTNSLPSVDTRYTTEDLMRCITAHFALLEPPKKPVMAVIRIGHRNTPLVKDTAWVATQKTLKKSIDIQLNINEVIMVNKNTGQITEGATSNFGILNFDECDNMYTFFTAPIESGILRGTVRQLVLDMFSDTNKEDYCKLDWLRIVERNPRLCKIDQWRGAFIMSTSRMCLPIDRLWIDINANDLETIMWNGVRRNLHLDRWSKSQQKERVDTAMQFLEDSNYNIDFGSSPKMHQFLNTVNLGILPHSQII